MARRTPPPPPTGDLAGADDVRTLVRRFYQQVLSDPLLRPVFDDADVDWPTHIPVLCAFWEKQLFGTPGWEGNLASLHVRVSSVSPFGRAEVERWLEIFSATVDESFVGPVAEHAKARAAQAGTVILSAVERAASAR